MLVDLAVDRKVENMQFTDKGMFLDPIKKDLEHVLLKGGFGTISDIRPVTEGYGEEISKYSMKFGLDINDDRLKEILVDMKGKRMVSMSGNCYGLKDMDDTDGEDMEELSPEDEEYITFGTIKEVVYKCFKETDIDSELVGYALGAVKIGIIKGWISIRFPGYSVMKMFIQLKKDMPITVLKA